MAINAACPSCGTRDVRLSRSRTFSESLLEVVGVYSLRCKRCDTRFRRSVWNLRNVVYARCPRCLRMELSTWSEQYYNPPLGTIVKLRLGATPYRCEFCRCNFASFRACKERFLWRKYRKAAAADSPQTSAGQKPKSEPGVETRTKSVQA